MAQYERTEQAPLGQHPHLSLADGLQQFAVQGQFGGSPPQTNFSQLERSFPSTVPQELPHLKGVYVRIMETAARLGHVAESLEGLAERCHGPQPIAPGQMGETRNAGEQRGAFDSIDDALISLLRQLGRAEAVSARLSDIA